MFSLRSQNSWGVGEFTDLPLLVDWSKSVGLKLIQLLPINDTSATLRYQFRRDQPLVNGTVMLDPLDADPLRALLRVGLGRVKPMAVPRKAASRAPARSLPSHSAASGHAASQQA